MYQWQSETMGIEVCSDSERGGCHISTRTAYIQRRIERICSCRAILLSHAQKHISSSGAEMYVANKGVAEGLWTVAEAHDWGPRTLEPA